MYTHRTIGANYQGVKIEGRNIDLTGGHSLLAFPSQGNPEPVRLVDAQRHQQDPGGGRDPACAAPQAPSDYQHNIMAGVPNLDFQFPSTGEGRRLPATRHADVHHLTTRWWKSWCSAKQANPPGAPSAARPAPRRTEPPPARSAATTTSGARCCSIKRRHGSRGALVKHGPRTRSPAARGEERRVFRWAPSTHPTRTTWATAFRPPDALQSTEGAAAAARDLPQCPSILPTSPKDKTPAPAAAVSVETERAATAR